MLTRPAERPAVARKIETEHSQTLVKQLRQSKRRPEGEKKEAQQLEASRKSLDFFLKLKNNPFSRYREKGYDWVYDKALNPIEIENSYPAAKEYADYAVSGDEEQLQKWNEFTPLQKQLIHLIVDKYNEGIKETKQTEAESGGEQEEAAVVEDERQARRASWLKLKPVLEELGVAAGADSQAVYDILTDEQVQEFYLAAQAILNYKDDGNEKHLKEWNSLTEEQQKLIGLIVDSRQEAKQANGDEAAA